MEEPGNESEPVVVEPVDDGGGASRIAATALVAAGVVVLLLAAAAASFFLIAQVVHGNWPLAAAALVALAVLYLLAKRFMRVAANQNKDPLG